MGKAAKKPKPVLVPELCKGCGRCIEACARGCLSAGTEINQRSGLTPIVIDDERCTACGLCFQACPEPWGLVREPYVLEDPKHLYGDRHETAAPPVELPARRIPLPRCEPMILKGNFAASVGAVLAGCRHVFGYPITPSSEGAELMADLLPRLRGVFMQAVSEVATVNHLYGCGGAGVPCLTFTSSPGFSLMLEGLSYMVGAELPGVFVNVMRAGPGLGNIGPAQADIGVMCRGLGHGDSQAIVLAPTSPQEMLDLTMEAFRLAFAYRNPVIVAADGYLGQITGRVNLPDHMLEPSIPGWAVYGDAAHRGNLHTSIYLSEAELEAHNDRLQAKFQRMQASEQRASCYMTEGAEILVLAANTPARMAKGTVQALRREGLPVGLFQPLTLWPFPIDALRPLVEGAVTDILVVEASAGQLEHELRLALSLADLCGLRIHHLRHLGGVLPQEGEITREVHAIAEVNR